MNIFRNFKIPVCHMRCYEIFHWNIINEFQCISVNTRPLSSTTFLHHPVRSYNKFYPDLTRLSNCSNIRLLSGMHTSHSLANESSKHETDKRSSNIMYDVSEGIPKDNLVYNISENHNESTLQIVSNEEILVTEDSNASDQYEVFDPARGKISMEELHDNCRQEAIEHKKRSVFEPATNLEDFDDFGPELRPTFNIPAYVNKSPTLQELVKLGVNISRFDEDLHKLRYVLSLRFEEDVKPHLMFLHGLGVSADKWGDILTRNIYLLKEDLDDLDKRVKYLSSKKFDAESIANIVATFPRWLSNSITVIDGKLGFLQKLFGLSGDEIRTMTTSVPKIVFENQQRLRITRVILHEDYDFSKEQMRTLLVNNPRGFLQSSEKLRGKLHLLIEKMELSTDTITRCDKTLTAKLHRLDSRHYFLRSLNRVQYDPTKPNYICPQELSVSTDVKFAVETARSSVHAFNTFLKTL